MTMTIRAAFLGLIISAAPVPPLAAHGPVQPKPAQGEAAKFAADRAAILAMAGNYKVTFDMRETTPWLSSYKPIPAKISSGHEIVRVIEDTGRSIKLQHILVASHEGKTVIIKHWRQDWTYEPRQVLVYFGPNRWTLEEVPAAMRKGRWSQTVWQTDDSPRYGGWGEWSSEGGIPRWRSNWTLRPLARRDAIRHPVYDRYLAINRHSPSPTGWIHWQDNMKQGLVDGKVAPIVQESVLNSYERFDGFNAAAGDAYWEKTKGYWAGVRNAWDFAIKRDKGLSLTEEPEAGPVTGPRLMALADEVADGRIEEAAAIAQALKLISATTAR